VIPVRLPIAHPAHTVIDQNVAMIVALQVIVQPVVRTEIAIHDQVRIVEIVAQVLIVQPVVHMEAAIHVHLLIVHVAKTHTVAIGHARAMTATRVRLHVTANVVADQIVPEVVSPMIAKSVHAVVLAKSA
jgi:hypothetical protein